MTTYIGFDIGKFEIHYHYCLDSQVIAGKVANNQADIVAFINTLPAQAHAIIEATGVYHFPLAFALHDKQIPLSLLNPSVSAAFARSLNSISKTDKLDSAMLARFGQERHPQATRLESAEWHSFRLLIDRWEELKVKRQAIDNQRQAHEFYPKVPLVVKQQLEAELSLIDSQIASLIEHIEQELPKEYEDLVQLASSVKGIGKKTAIHLIFFTRGLQDFSSHRQVAKYLGIAPNVYQSGRTTRKGRICRRGQSLLRSLLYNCAKSAKRFNKACKDLYERLKAKGKPHKVAMVAVMHKLVKQFFAVIKNGKPYAEHYPMATQT